MQSPVREEHSSKRDMPLFILGTQRSGSTLLTRILSSHPRVFVQNELPLPRIFDGAGGAAELRDRVLQSICQRLGTAPGAFLQHNDIWGLKDPQLTEYLPSLRDLPPDTRFILLVRDPRAVVNSYMENRWGLGTNAFTGAQRWVREVNAQLDFMAEREDTVLLLRYEDLVSNVEGSISGLCAFLGLEPHDSMRSFFRSDPAYRTNRQNENTNRDIDQRLAERWRMSLTHREVGLIEAVASREMERLGYRREAEPVVPSTPTRLWYLGHQAFVGELQLQYQLRKAALRRRLKTRRSRNAT